MPRLTRSTSLILTLLCAGLLGACIAQSPLSRPPQIRHTPAFAMPDSYSAKVVEEILRAGGNAVDAAVAAAFTLAVTYPEAGNIGGGGFMLLHVDGETSFLDYRETAPAAAHRDMYLDEAGQVIADLSLVGHQAAAVPGTVAGLWAAHFRHGRLTWEEVVMPAARLAQSGFIAHPQLAQRIREKAPTFLGRTEFDAFFSKVASGDLVQQPELAATLRRIASDGVDGFYQGETARLIEAEMRRGGGLISRQDLANYRPVWREPLRATWREYEVLTSPPPSSGGIALIQLLKMKDYLAERFAGLEHNSAGYMHLVAEMEKRVFADRAEYLGDPAFHRSPTEALLDNGYIFQRASAVNASSISSIDTVRPGLTDRSDTTHFSIVDRWGNAVANTYTLNTLFGNGVVVRGAGFLLNSEMDDFSAKPGVPNYYGVVGSTANEIQPGKRMLSSMTPTLLLKDGRVHLVVGTPGGSTIFTSVFQTMINLIDFQMTPQQAVGASRFHHQLLPPDLITYSPSRPPPQPVIEGLNGMGYRVEPHDWEFGDVQVIWMTGDNYDAASDPRWRGQSRVLPQ
jgi:gamma-glutamyltranspeptidase/glutathione hydrolase